MRTTATPLAALAADAVATAVLAPSLHNTQPWRFRLRRDDVLELRADRTRQLWATDPSGRQLTVSCGAALLGLRLALAGRGVRPEVTVRPDASDRDLLAEVRAGERAPATPEELVLLAAVARRRSHRGRFDGPVEPGLAVRLQQAAAAEGTRLVLVQRPGTRRAVADVVAAAERAQAGSPDVRAELEDWTPAAAEGRLDGVPESAYPRRPPPQGAQELPVRDFAAGREQGRPAEVVLPDAAPVPPLVAVLVTAGDGPAAWLAAGAGLHRVLLTAAAEGVQATLSSSATELEGLRRLLQEELLLEEAPQILLQLGLAPGRSPAGASPRRGVEDVLERV